MWGFAWAAWRARRGAKHRAEGEARKVATRSEAKGHALILNLLGHVIG
jgi:hypothetical protein